MNITVVGSGSNGNCYIIQEIDGSSVILDCGISFQTITKNANFPQFNKIDFVFCSHSHSDHNKSLKDFKLSGCDIISYETLNNSIEHFSRNNWDITTFPLAHNVANFGIIIKSKLTGTKICYMTDFYKCPKIEGCDIFLYEINYIYDYIDEMIEEDKELKHTNFKYHNSLENAICYFSELKTIPKYIICCHLSKNNSIKQRILNSMIKFADNVTIAKKNDTYKI